VSDGAVSQVLHAVNQHQHELLERDKTLIKTDYLHRHTPVTLAVLHPAGVLVPYYYIPNIALHRREQLLTHILH
jgi:hypothetical protein